MKIIHLSDIHIGKSNNTANFESIVRWIIDRQDEHGAELVVITGDVVDDGSLGQYRVAQTQIKKLRTAGLEVLSAPGNHDYGSNGIVENHECMTRFRKYISGDVDYPYPVERGDYTLIMLDSMQEEMKNYELWGAQGELGKGQLSELDRLLNNIEENQISRKVVLALHHHPFYYNYFLKLRDDELLKQVIMDEDQGDCRVDCLLFGHKHVEKRFTDKEKKYNIGLVYASASSTERNSDGKLVVPVIDLVTNRIKPFQVD